MSSNFCPECGGKISFDEKTEKYVCNTCGEEYFPDKKWLKQQSGRKKKDLYTVMPFTSDIAWKPGKIEAKLKETFDEREEREKAVKGRTQGRFRPDRKRSKRDDNWKARDY